MYIEEKARPSLTPLRVCLGQGSLKSYGASNWGYLHVKTALSQARCLLGGILISSWKIWIYQPHPRREWTIKVCKRKKNTGEKWCRLLKRLGTSKWGYFRIINKLIFRAIATQRLFVKPVTEDSYSKALWLFLRGADHCNSWRVLQRGKAFIFHLHTLPILSPSHDRAFKLYEDDIKKNTQFVKPKLFKGETATSFLRLKLRNSHYLCINLKINPFSNLEKNTFLKQCYRDYTLQILFVRRWGSLAEMGT